MVRHPRKLKQTDVLYRALHPRHHNEHGPLYGGFEYTGKKPGTGERSDALSFFTTPTAALGAFANSDRAKQECKTGNVSPTAEQLYRFGYRVAALSARDVIEFCKQPELELEISADDSGNQIDASGHVQIRNGQEIPDTWARRSRILSEEETLGPPAPNAV